MSFEKKNSIEYRDTILLYYKKIQNSEKRIKQNDFCGRFEKQLKVVEITDDRERIHILSSERKGDLHIL